MRYVNSPSDTIPKRESCLSATFESCAFRPGSWPGANTVFDGSFLTLMLVYPID